MGVVGWWVGSWVQAQVSLIGSVVLLIIRLVGAMDAASLQAAARMTGQIMANYKCSQPQVSSDIVHLLLCFLYDHADMSTVLLVWLGL